MNKDHQISKRSNTSKSKKTNHKIKKKNYLEMENEEKKIKGKINNEINPYEENNINSKNKNYNELSNKNNIKEECNRKDVKSKSKSKKINSKKNKNSIESNISEEIKKINNKKIFKLKKIIKILIYIKNL